MDRLLPESTVLVVVDIQERLASAMESARMEQVVANTQLLLEAARLLRVPVLATEQYPKGLGGTVPALRSQLSEMGVSPIEKLDFDACGAPEFARELGRIAPRAAVVVGMETHVCVFQTARELVRRGLACHVVSDAVVSRRESHREVGLALAERAGAFVTVAETVVFDWLGRAGTEPFKALSRRIKG